MDFNDENVSHPKHYRGRYGIEVIDVIDNFTADMNAFEAVYTANAIKYILRWKNKNGVQDLKKAVWYIERLIKRLETKGEKTNEIQ